MIALFVLLGFIGLCVYAFIADKRDDRKRHENCKYESIGWLYQQFQLPKFYVHVLTKTGKVYITEPFEPTSKVEYWYRGWHVVNFDSLTQAKDRIERSISTGRFYNQSTETFIPLCEIEYMQAKEYSEKENK